MTARVKTVAFQGIEVLEVDVQVQVAPGVVSFAVVGLADKAVGESRERVRAALNAIGLALPPRRITRLGRREARRHAVALGKLEVRPNLGLELSIEPPAPDEGEESLPGTPHQAFASRKRATSAVACCQLLTSTCSCFAPAFVSE